MLDLGVEFRAGKRIDSLKSLLAEPLGRRIRRQRRAARPRPRRAGPQRSCGEHPHRARLARERLVRPHHEDRQASHRAGRRQHGDGLLPELAPAGRRDVQVIVRSGFDEMKASPWEKEDAMHEGIPIHNFLVPKEFTHDAGKLTGVTFEKVTPRIDDERAARARADRRARRCTFPATTCWSRSGRKTHFPGSSATSASSSTGTGCRCSTRATMAVDPRRRLLRRRLGVRPEEHHLGGRAWARGGDLDRPAVPRRGLARATAAAREPRSRRRWASTSGATTTRSPATAASGAARRTRRSR